METIREKCIRYGIAGLVFALPILFFMNRLYPHISSKTFFMYGVVEILAALWIYTIIVDHAYRPSRTFLYYCIPLFGFLVWMTIAALVSGNAYFSFFSSIGRGTGLLTLYHSALVLLMVGSLVRKHGMGFVRQLFQWFVVGALCLAISIWFGTDGFNIPQKALLTDRGGGLMGNSTLAGAYLLFALGMALFLILEKETSRAHKWFSGISIAVIVCSPVFFNVPGALRGLSLLGSARGVILGVVVGIGIGATALLILSKRRAVRWIGISLAILGFVAFGIAWNRLMTPGTVFHESFERVAKGTRFIFWDIAEQGMRERPLFGYGPENYFRAFQTYFNPKILLSENNIEGWNDRAHNIYYEMGIWGGYPGMALYFAFVASLFVAIVYAWKRGALSSKQASLIAGMVGGYIFQNLFSFDSVPALVALFALGGIVFGFADSSPHQSQTRSLAPKWKQLVIILLVLATGVTWYFFAFLPSRKAKAFADVFKQPYVLRYNLYPKLLKGATIGNTWDASGLAFDVYRSIAGGNLSSIKSSKEQSVIVARDVAGLINYLETLGETVHDDYRLTVTTIYLYNTLAYLTGTPYNADVTNHVRDLGKHAIALNKNNPNVYWALAQMEVWAGDLKAAENNYRTALAIEPTLPASYRLYIAYAQTTGNQKLAAALLAEAQKNIPGFTLEK